MASTFDDKWFQNSGEKDDLGEYYINERAVRARAGILLLISAALLFTRLDHGHHMEMLVVSSGMDHAAMDHAAMGHASDNMVHTSMEIVPREYSHTHVFIMLAFVMYEMIMPMFRKTAKFSLTARVGALMTQSQTPTYIPMRPKVLAWTIGFSMAAVCTALVYAFVTFGFMSIVPLMLLVVCFSFMWLEATCNICAACILYGWLARAGVLREVCPTCTINGRSSIQTR